MNMKHSRILIFAAIMTLSAAFSTDTLAKTTCQQGPQGQVCIAQIDFNSFAQNSYQDQQSSQWCWAASISMLFSYYNHPVSQQAIVQSLYGTLVDLPSGSGWNIASRLNTTWTDANGKRFRAQLTGAYDFDAGVMTINNATLVNELDQDRPVIIGTRGHAVVGTAIEFVPGPMGPIITGIGVFDPWPGRGARPLDQSEMLAMHLRGELRFLATVRVTELK